MAACLRLTFIAVGVFRIFNKTVKLFFIIRHGCYRAGRLLEIYARTLTCPQHAQKACAWFLLFTKNVHIRRDEPDFSTRVDIHFKVVVQSPSKDSSKTRSQPRELVKIEYYCATKKQRYIRWNLLRQYSPRSSPLLTVSLDLLKFFSFYRAIIIIFLHRCSYVLAIFIRFHRFLNENITYSFRVIIGKMMDDTKLGAIFRSKFLILYTIQYREILNSRVKIITGRILLKTLPTLASFRLYLFSTRKRKSG